MEFLVTRELAFLPGDDACLGPEAALMVSGMCVQILPIFRARLPLHQRHILLEGQDLSMQAFDLDRLDVPPWLPDLEVLFGGVHPTGDPLACQSSAHVVVLTVDRQIATSPYGPRKGLLVYLHEPAVRIDGLWNSRQRRELLAGHTRRLVAAGTCLVGTLVVVMGQKRLRGFLHLLVGTGQMHLQTLLTKRAMKALDVGVQIGSMRGDDIGRHPHTPEEAN